jgi:hypothetical protein
MASKTAAGLTEKEMSILALAWNCVDEQPKVCYNLFFYHLGNIADLLQIDHDKLAKLGGYKNPRSVANLVTGKRHHIKTYFQRFTLISNLIIV